MLFKVVMTKRSLPPAEQMSPCFRWWLQWMALYEDATADVVDSHSRAVRRLVAYSGVLPGEFGPGSFDQALMMDTLTEMKTDLAIGTIRDSIHGLEAFYDFCIEDRLISWKPNFERIKLCLHNRAPDGPYEFSSFDEQMPPSFQEWLHWLNLYEGRSQRTIRSRSSDIRRVLSCSDISPSEFGPESLDQVRLEDTVREMKMGGKVAVAAIHRSLKSLEAFYDFCLYERLISDKPDFFKIARRLPQSPKALREPRSPQWSGDSYDPDELGQLLKAANSPSPAGSSRIRWPARDLAIVSLLGVVGLRPGELVNAQESWINDGPGWGSSDSAEPILYLNVKTRPGHLNIPLSLELTTVLKRWRDERGQRLGTPQPDELLIISNDGEGFTTQRLRGLLRVLNHEAGLRNRPPSTLRGTVQRRLVEEGFSLTEIQRLMGHRGPSGRR